MPPRLPCPNVSGPISALVEVDPGADLGRELGDAVGAVEREPDARTRRSRCAAAARRGRSRAASRTPGSRSASANLAMPFGVLRELLAGLEREVAAQVDRLEHGHREQQAERDPVQARSRGAGSDRRRRAPTNAGREHVLERDVARARRPVQLVPRRDDAAVASSRRSSHGRSVITRAIVRRPAQRRARSAPVTSPLACTIAGSGSRMSNVPSTGSRPASRAARGAATCPPARDARRCAAATTQRRPSCRGPGAHRARGPAEHVEVGDARQVDAARPRKAVPLPQARVHLHQLEAPVARVEPELGLCDAVEAERRRAAPAPARRRRRASAPRPPGRCRSRAASARACARRTGRARCPRRRCRSRPSRAWRRRRG